MPDICLNETAVRDPAFGPDPFQQAAISHRDGPALILAGPGSGKTYVITHRIAELISNVSVSPEQILVLTFTKAAALQMQSRARALMRACEYVTFGTFHSVFYQILKKSGKIGEKRLISDGERLSFVKKALLGRKMSEREAQEQTERIVSGLSRMKNRMEKEPDKLLWELYQMYQSWLSDQNAIDFDDMILLCFEYLNTDEEGRRLWQNRFLYVLIDEFQDINPLQYAVIRLLCEKNLFCVGDDDQSIYGFRGSDPSLMRRFCEDYHPRRIELGVNYRSSMEIVRASANLIGKNKDRLTKEIAAYQCKPAISVNKQGFMTENEMRQACANRVLLSQNRNPSLTQAVLLRTNREAEIYKTLIFGGAKVSETGIDLLSYLSFINEGRRRSDFIRIMNKPSRYIPKDVLTEERITEKAIADRLSKKPWASEPFHRFMKQCDFLEGLDLYAQVTYIWEVCGYKRYVREQCERAGAGIRFEREREEYEKLRETARNHKKLSGLVKELNGREEEKRPGIRSRALMRIQVMTYHSSKGLEFDKVYLPELNYGKVPRGRMLTRAELEEERRMFYVAMTRAKEELFLYYVGDEKHPERNPSIPSPFLSEITDRQSSSSNSTLSKNSSKASSTASNSSSSSM